MYRALYDAIVLFVAFSAQLTPTTACPATEDHFEKPLFSSRLSIRASHILFLADQKNLVI
jgi:hypothetical protein